MFNIGPMELIVILLLALIVVGPSKLPEVGRSIGRGLREFRRAQDEVRHTLALDLEDEPPRRAARSSARPTRPGEAAGGADPDAPGDAAGASAEGDGSRQQRPDAPPAEAGGD